MYLLKQLIPIDLGDAALILPTLGTRNAIDLLDGFGVRKLDDASASKLSSLLDRVGKHNVPRDLSITLSQSYPITVDRVVPRSRAILFRSQNDFVGCVRTRMTERGCGFRCLAAGQASPPLPLEGARLIRSTGKSPTHLSSPLRKNILVFI